MRLEYFSHSQILAPFFFLIGLQLRSETTHVKQILLPSFAALGGMILPASIFLLLNDEITASAGWPMVMPTDIALVMIVLLCLGQRVPIELKTFLLALAVADDLLSIIILALKYSSALKLSEILASIGAVIVGVLVGRVAFQNWLERIVNFVILPVYIFANIYPAISEDFSLISPLGNSIVVARVFGKIIGITLFTLVAVKLFKLSLNFKIAHLLAGATFAAMGLAVSIMVANLSYQSEQLLNQAKSGLLIAAAISALLGAIILILTSPDRSKKI